MKKSIRKRLSLLFAAVTLLSTMSMVALATEEVAPCAACTHPHYEVTGHAVYGDTDKNGHYVTYCTLYTCATCNKQYIDDCEPTIFELHTFEKGKCIYCGYQNRK